MTEDVNTPPPQRDGDLVETLRSAVGGGHTWIDNGNGEIVHIPPDDVQKVAKEQHHPAAFINAIWEEGTKEEAIKYLQETWNELCEARKEIAALKGIKREN